MVSHLTIGVDNPVEAFADASKNIQPQLPIFVDKNIAFRPSPHEVTW